MLKPCSFEYGNCLEETPFTMARFHVASFQNDSVSGVRVRQCYRGPPLKVVRSDEKQ